MHVPTRSPKARPAALALLVLAAGPTAAVQTGPGPARLPVLVVSGANNHDWEWTHRSLSTLLAESGRFDVDVTLDPATDLADPERLAAYRAVVLDYNGPRWGEAAEEAFAEAVDRGLGVTVVHAANNAFEGWEAYETIVGHLWREGTGHGRFHAFDVEVVRRDHPITSQLPTLRAHPDELYHRLVDTQGVTRSVLAEALSARETGGTGEREPMVLVGRYGAGRVFHTPLGHVWPGQPETRASHEDPQFRVLVVRGTEWAASGHVSEVDPDAGVVPAELARAGWRSLFDGETTAGWRALAGDAFPTQGWSVVDRCLVHAKGGGGGDIVTTEAYGDFELSFEFLLTPGANSGVKLGIPAGGPAIGPEYQVLDDAGHPDGAAPSRRSGAIYDVVPADEDTKLLHPPGRWNHARIVRRDGVLEHWLNGRRTARADTRSPAWEAAVARSKFSGRPDFGRFERGHVLLQDHGDEVWYRNLFVRPLDPPAGEPTELFDGADLAGWSAHGDAVYAAEDGELIGRVGGGGQSFLVSDGAYADFVFELELRNDDAGNSGVQFRSHLNEAGRLYGYQMEVDPSPRSWSGGLYDEYRRAWLDDLAEDAAARAAFRDGGWNTYRIEAVGPWLRGWVNGVPTFDHVDPLDLEGHFALQVHSGNNTAMRWRDLRLWRLPAAEPLERQATWAVPASSACPLGRGADHVHAFLDARVKGTGMWSVDNAPGALRLGLARTLTGGSLGMAAGAPGFRAVERLTEGGLVLDETLAFTVVELAGTEDATVHATFLDDRLSLHRDGALLLDVTVPASRWGGSLQLFQCLPEAPSTPPTSRTVWRGF